jgi:hypothetical protein
MRALVATTAAERRIGGRRVRRDRGIDESGGKDRGIDGPILSCAFFFRSVGRSSIAENRYRSRVVFEPCRR